MAKTTTAFDDQPDEVQQLREENARLRAELDEARGGKPAGRREFHVPDFLPEGTRDELERNGRAINPFNGDKLGGPWPDEDKQQ